MAAAGAPDGDVSWPGGQLGVGGEVVEELAGAGGGQDDVLHAGVEAVEVEDVAGGGRVAEAVADVLDAVGGRRDGAAVGVFGEVEVAERRQHEDVGVGLGHAEGSFAGRRGWWCCGGGRSRGRRPPPQA